MSMTAIDHDPEWLAAYREAERLDQLFQSAVIRQFGRHNAGTMRYVASKHNAETKAAGEAYWLAAHALGEMTRERRKRV